RDSGRGDSVMTSGKRRFVSMVVLGSLSFLGLGCAATSTGSQTATAAVSAETIIIDVRMPEEFAAGHLDGALLYDIQDPNFDALIAELDRSLSYVVYCRSGNRSVRAVERMAAAGFTNLVDLGSLENASAVMGIAIVQN
ncbi:MAG: rhodanese-like domain-containing protein, partial [Ilumatobacteraceae bacterium]